MKKVFSKNLLSKYNLKSYHIFKKSIEKFQKNKFFSKNVNNKDQATSAPLNNGNSNEDSSKGSVTKFMTEWQIMRSKHYLFEDLNTGILVATVALPLCLAISIASGVPAYVGLITSILGALFCTINGGSKLGISGPAAALSVVVSTIGMKFGFTGLLISTIICGVLQITMGFLKYGNLIKYVPITVIEGFTAGNYLFNKNKRNWCYYISRAITKDIWNKIS
jgi:MFS superfamily sulfate permease-like transporter